MFEPYLRGLTYKYLKVIKYPKILILEIHFEDKLICYLKWRWNSNVPNDSYEFKSTIDNNKKNPSFNNGLFRYYFDVKIENRYRKIRRVDLSFSKVKQIYNRYYAVQWLLVCKHLNIFYKDLVNYIKDLILF